SHHKFSRLSIVHFFFKQKTAYEIETLLEFRRVLFRSLWHYSLDAEGDLPEVHEKRNLATSSPVTDGAHVYAWFSNGQLAALDVRSEERRVGKECRRQGARGPTNKQAKSSNTGTDFVQ